MDWVKNRKIQHLLTAIAVIIALFLIPLKRPGFNTWQPQYVTQLPADRAGQTFISEYSNPIRIDLPVMYEPSWTRSAPELSINVSILTYPPQKYTSVPYIFDEDAALVKVLLSGIRVKPGTRIQIDIDDPQTSTWVGGTEFDSYSGGDRIQNGAIVDGDLAFRLIYQRSLASVMLQGLSLITKHAGFFLALCIAFVSTGLFAAGILQKLIRLDLAAWISFVLGSGVIINATLGYAAALLRIRFNTSWMFPVLVTLAVLGLFFWRRGSKTIPHISTRKAVWLVLWLIFMLTLRIAYATDLALPPHVDSIENYSIVLDMLSPHRARLAVNQIENLPADYYHLGFHALTAWLFALSGKTDPSTYIIFGQVLQTLAIGTLYFPVYSVTKDRRVAALTVLIASLGWIMPGYASNWGKFSALSGLVATPVIVGLIAVVLQSKDSRRRQVGLAAGAAAFAATLIHTRIIFIISTYLIALALAALSRRFASRPENVRSGLAIAATLILAVIILLASGEDAIIAAQRTLTRVLADQGMATTLLILAATPFAILHFFLPAVTCAIWSLLMFLFQFLPPNVPYPFPFLDGPMVSMALFIPLSGLGAMGFVGFIRTTQEGILDADLRTQVRYALVVLGVLHAALSISNQRISAHDCCLIAGRDDAAVAKRVKTQLPLSARILIPGTSPPGYTLVPVDGGAWLKPLSRRAVVAARNEIDFSLPEQHSNLCTQGITHIYLGMRAESFQREALDLAPDFYQAVIAYPRAALYALEGCDQP